MPGWDKIETLVNLEEMQLIEEGIEPDAARRAAEAARALVKSGADEYTVWASFSGLPMRGDFEFVEPSDLPSIRAARNGKAPALRAPDPTDPALLDKLHGAWLGRCAGCALGKPSEGFMGAHNGMASWERHRKYLSAISPDEWPVKDYYPAHSPAEAETGRGWCPASTREQIAFMESDDDIRYTVLGQIILRSRGRDFLPAHVANAWLRHLPYTEVCTAETQAYRNMVLRGTALRSGSSKLEDWTKIDAEMDWTWIVHHLNPYREWIGAQIRVDSYGYASPGDPELAAEFAWRDARISHVKNGIYGAMFLAAMISAAFATSDPRTIVHAGLAQIPASSRLYRDIQQTLEICDEHGNDINRFEDVFRAVYALLGHYHPVHTNNNAALCVVALMLGQGDFHHGITLAVMGGLDSDCNGASVGSIVGAICGASGAPAHWTARLNNTLKSQIIDYHPIPISDCAQRAMEIVKAIQTT